MRANTLVAGISDRVTRMDIDGVGLQELGSGCGPAYLDVDDPTGRTDTSDGQVAATYDYQDVTTGLFKPLPPPILQRPEHSAPTQSTARGKHVYTCRSSSRLGAGDAPHHFAHDDAKADEAEETMHQEDCDAAFSSGMFKATPVSILQRPKPPTPHTGRSKKKVLSPCRSSSRLAARPSSVPVAERAQQKLMREPSFINAKSAAPDAAINAYVDLHGDNLPDQAVRVIRAAAKLDNKELSKALAAIAAESGVAELEEA